MDTDVDVYSTWHVITPFSSYCDRENLKICFPDNLSLLESSHFKSDGIWVLEKSQRLM